MRVRRGIIPLVALVGLLVVGIDMGVGTTVARAEPSPAAEDDFTQRIAGERLGAGLMGYEVAPDLVDVARRHAEEMARQDRLFHNPRLASEVKNWDSVGENVGTGESVADIHRAFMESSTHRSEILNRRFTQVGVGVVERDGLIWVAQVFRKPTAPTPAPAPASAASPSPGVTTTVASVVVPTTTSTSTSTSTSIAPIAAPVITPTPETVTNRVSTVAGSTLQRPPAVELQEVTAPTVAAATLLVLVVAALAAQVAAESRRTVELVSSIRPTRRSGDASATRPP